MTPNTPLYVDHETIVLSQNGIWLADGVEITHETTRRAFARSLKKDPEGYRIQIGRETKRIEVEDTAYFVQRIDGDPQTGFQLLINDESREELDPKTLKYRPGRLTCLVKSKTEEAKFLHAAYFDLLKFLQEDQSGYFLEFGSGNRVDLAPKA